MRKLWHIYVATNYKYGHMIASLVILCVCSRLSIPIVPWKVGSKN